MTALNPVMVTGGSGYIASWLIKYLLDEGYPVRTTVRDPGNIQKHTHLLQLAEQSEGRLELFKADLLEEGTFQAAMEGCETVYHTASPFFVSGIKDAQRQLIEPALQGTRNVLHSVNQMPAVKRVVLTSSVAAIYGDSADLRKVPGGAFTEKQWNESSSLTYQPYSYSKTLAEREAWKLARAQDRWELLVINPGFVLGPSLTPRTDSTSIDFMLSFLNGKFKAGVPALSFGVVDVRDVARAHVLAATTPTAGGRHILVAQSCTMMEMAAVLKEFYGDRYPIPTRTLPNWLVYLLGPLQGFSWKYLRNNLDLPLHFDNSYSQEDLGIRYRAVDDTLIAHAEQLIEQGAVQEG